MGTASIIFIASAVLLIAVAVMVRAEELRARRFIGGRVRAVLDTGIIHFEERFARKWRHLSRYMVQLGWYYSIHSLLVAVMKVLVSLYEGFEQIFERNRARTKLLRKEFKTHQQSHLTAMADHKEAVALSPDEQIALREKKLTEDH